MEKEFIQSIKRIVALTSSITVPATTILVGVFFTTIFETTAVASSSSYPQIPENLALNSETNQLVRINQVIEPSEIAWPVDDNRVKALRRFFEKYNSPLLDNAETFVITADKHGVDYKILPAISCAESTCGKFLPTGSHNPFGWGVRDAYNYIGFDSYDEAITEIGKGMDEIYFKKGRTEISTIAPVYNPVTPDHWTRNVSWFANQIAEIEEELNLEDNMHRTISVL